MPADHKPEADISTGANNQPQPASLASVILPTDIKPVTETDWFNNPALKKLFAKMLTSGDEIRIVGGAARNHLLGEPVNDIDLATTFTPDQIITRAKKAGIKTLPTGIDHGTVTLIIDDTAFELTTLRKDISTDGRHATVEFGTDWLEDAKRRDFTINALYISADGTWYDPLGSGLKDIKTRSIRFIGSAKKRIREDYLRSLRFYRFNAYYGHAPYDEEAISATVQLRAGLASLSKERVSSELLKILKASGAKEILKLLYQTGLLTSLLGTVPNIAKALKLIMIEESLKSHGGNMPTPEANPVLRLAALAAWAPGDGGRLQQRFCLSKQQKNTIKNWLNARTFPPLTSKLQQDARHYTSGKANFLDELISAWSRSNASPNDTNWAKLYQQAENTTLPEFPISGQDLINHGYDAGPALGQKLKSLQNIWLDSGMKKNRQELLASLKG